MQQNVLAAQKVVMNVRFDQANFRRQQSLAPVLEETYNVLENEILVARKGQRVINNYKLPRVQSWWKTAANGAEETEALAKFRFYGVAVTPHTANAKYMIDQGFVACIGGICKAVNESGSTIRSGELLTYKVNSAINARPDVRQPGVPRDKCRFTFVKYNPGEAEHLAHGIVGKALSNARVHSPFDVLIVQQPMRPPADVYNILNTVGPAAITAADQLRTQFDRAYNIA